MALVPNSGTTGPTLPLGFDYLGHKEPCVVAAETNITLSGEQTIASVAVTQNQRVLVTAQASSNNNGIYVAAKTAWTRALDFDAGTKFRKGTRVVAFDSSGGRHDWVVISDPPTLIGGSAITFAIVAPAVEDLSGVNSGDQDASQVPYDNSTSLLAATDVQAALDELDAAVDAGGSYTDEQAQDAVGGILTGLSYNDATPSIAAIRVAQIQVSDPNGSAITTGDGKAYFRVNSQLNGYNLTAVAASVTTVSSSGIPTVQIANVTDSVDMLSTKLTIDANETDSSTAATAAVIDGAHDDVAAADMLRIDIDVAGTGTKGLIVELTFQLP